MKTTNETLEKVRTQSKSYLGFDQNKAGPLVDQLNHLLACYNVYYQNLRNFHWNIYGENFFDLHNQFEQLYNDARVKIDDIAERILTLRHQPLSRMTDYLEVSHINESPLLEDDREMVLTTLENHRVLIERMRKILSVAGELEDEGTIDMIGGFLENLEKKSWMLDAWSTRKMKLPNS